MVLFIDTALRHSGDQIPFDYCLGKSVARRKRH
jgi:hypothetical protein